MPFDRLSSGGINPPIIAPVVTPPPPVYNTQAVVDHGVDQINKIIDAFSPLSIAERKAKLAQATYLMKAYQLANAGHPELLQMMNHPMMQLQMQSSQDRHQIAQLALQAKQRLDAQQAQKASALAQQNQLRSAVGAYGADLSTPQESGLNVQPEGLDTLTQSLIAAPDPSSSQSGDSP